MTTYVLMRGDDFVTGFVTPGVPNVMETSGDVALAANFNCPKAVTDFLDFVKSQGEMSPRLDELVRVEL